MRTRGLREDRMLKKKLRLLMMRFYKNKALN